MGDKYITLLAVLIRSLILSSYFGGLIQKRNLSFLRYDFINLLPIHRSEVMTTLTTLPAYEEDGSGRINSCAVSLFS